MTPAPEISTRAKTLLACGQHRISPTSLQLPPRQPTQSARYQAVGAAAAAEANEASNHQYRLCVPGNTTAYRGLAQLTRQLIH